MWTGSWLENQSNWGRGQCVCVHACTSVCIYIMVCVCVRDAQCTFFFFSWRSYIGGRISCGSPGGPTPSKLPSGWSFNGLEGGRLPPPPWCHHRCTLRAESEIGRCACNLTFHRNDHALISVGFAWQLVSHVSQVRMWQCSFTGHMNGCHRWPRSLTTRVSASTFSSSRALCCFSDCILAF